MKIIFAEQSDQRQRLLPLTYTRPIADLRVGILTISDKWCKHFQSQEFGYQTAAYLAEKFGPLAADEQTIWILNGVLPNYNLAEVIGTLRPGEALAKEGEIIASRGIKNPLEVHTYEVKEFTGEFDQINRTWDLFRLNGQEIRLDYELITKGRESQPINDSHTITYGSQIFLEEGASVKAAVLNAENGPIYIGKDAEVQEGALIRGPFAMGAHSVVNMGAKVRGDSSAGPHCKMGGEISNSIFWGYSNKGHDGFLGNAVIGEWCNLGADTNNSNLKNNYDPVRMWDYETNSFIHTNLQFCGLIMGDHSKCGINTMFNTGTTVGVASNIFGEGFPRNMIPSFAWGGASGMVTHNPRKAFITAGIVMKRRNLSLTDTDKAILNHIFEVTAQYRAWEQ